MARVARRADSDKYKWWPGRIASLTEGGEWLRPPRTGKYLAAYEYRVAFYGDHTHSWTPQQNLAPYNPAAAHATERSNAKRHSFREALREAKVEYEKDENAERQQKLEERKNQVAMNNVCCTKCGKYREVDSATYLKFTDQKNRHLSFLCKDVRTAPVPRPLHP